MDHYRIYRSVDIQTVKTESAYVTMRLDEGGKLHCVGTGASIEAIARDTYFGRLGVQKTDEQKREYWELTSGQDR